MKTTPLTEKHIELGAKMVEYAGYNMPVYYTNISEEHNAVRNNVGVFDVSHMGEFIVRGARATEFLSAATSNNPAKLSPGEVQYSCIPNKKGGIVDDLLIYRLDDDPAMTEDGIETYMLVVNASNTTKDLRWLRRIAKEYGVEIKNISAQTGLIAVQGPNAVQCLQSLTREDLSSIKYYTFKRGRFAGRKNIIISATGYTGSGGFEIYGKNRDILKIWEKIFEKGEKFDIKPAGLGARDTLRLEMGFCLYGNDINDKTSPIEAGLGWITKLKKAADFPSKDRFIKQREEGVRKRLVGFELEGRRVPRHGYTIKSKRGALIGEVTSGTHSPSLDKSIGMGYVKVKHAEPGTSIKVVVGSKEYEGTVVKLPFYK